MVKTVVVGLCFFYALSPVSADGLNFPFEILQSYEDLRAKLMVSSWVPDNSKGDGVTSFPEVRCGSKMCFADWAKDGKTAVISLWEDDNGTLRVAAQID